MRNIAPNRLTVLIILNCEICLLGIIIIIVVVVTGFFGYAQDRTSSKIMDSFKKMITHTATVIRDGRVLTINSETLVKGDVVLIKFGSKVPADVRIIENFGMKVGKYKFVQRLTF